MSRRNQFDRVLAKLNGKEAEDAPLWKQLGSLTTSVVEVTKEYLWFREDKSWQEEEMEKEFMVSHRKGEEIFTYFVPSLS